MKLEILHLIPAFPFRLVFDEEVTEQETETTVDDESTEPEPEPKPKGKPKLKVPLSSEQQDFVNSLVAEERRKGKSQTDKLITQLETWKNQAGTTQAEKESLEQRIQDLKDSQLTQTELSKTEHARERKRLEKERDDAIKKAQLWEQKYTTSTIERSIVDAATSPGHKAHNPRHIVSELAPKTRLVEVLDDEGKPTGELQPKVKMFAQKDGKTVTLDMTVTEAVKFMSEQDEHAPLFVSGASGGLGGSPNARRIGGGGDPGQPPTDINEYKKWRDEQKKKS